MNIKGRCERVTTEPVNSRSAIQVEVEGFYSDDLSVLELIQEIGADKFLEAIGEDQCLEHFGITKAEEAAYR